MVAGAIDSIQQGLAEHADPATKDWWEGYLKGAIDFRGVKMAGIRSVVHDWHATAGHDWPPSRL
jgi:hypothetical protein